MCHFFVLDPLLFGGSMMFTGTRYWANSKARSIFNDLQECVWFQSSPVGGYLDWNWVTHVEACWGRTGCSGPTGPQLKVKRPTPSRRIHRESWVFGMVKGNRSMGIHGDPWGWDQAPPRVFWIVSCTQLYPPVLIDAGIVTSGLPGRSAWLLELNPGDDLALFWWEFSEEWNRMNLWSQWTTRLIAYIFDRYSLALIMSVQKPELGVPALASNPPAIRPPEVWLRDTVQSSRWQQLMQLMKFPIKLLLYVYIYIHLKFFFGLDILMIGHRERDIHTYIYYIQYMCIYINTTYSNYAYIYISRNACVCVCVSYICLKVDRYFNFSRLFNPYPRTAPRWRVSPLVMASRPSRPGPWRWRMS